MDSRTTTETVAYETAKRDGLKTGFRNVPFLDDVQTKAAVKRQLQIAIRGAKEKGEAIAIGHPHAVTLEGSFRFWARNSAGKYSLDVGELRAAFLGRTDIADRVRAFRADRLAQINADQTPIPLKPSPKVVVHLVPYEAFGTPASLELNAVTGSGLFHPPFEAGASTTRWNLDGLLTYDRSREDQGAHAYAQLFRTGIHEGVEASMIGHLQSDRPGPPIFYGGWMDASLGRHLANPFAVLERIGVRPPIVLLVSVLGIRNYQVVQVSRTSRMAIIGSIETLSTFLRLSSTRSSPTTSLGC